MNGRTLSPRNRRTLLASLLVLWFCGLTACARTPYVWATHLPPERAKPEAERVTFEAGDSIVVTVSGQAALSGSHVVGVDGTIAVPNVGAINIGGLSVEQAEEAVAQRLATIISEPRLSIVVISRSIQVTILGEVARQGKYLLGAGDGVASALAVAGGVTEFGNKNAVYLIRATEPLRIRFRMKDLVRGGRSADSFALRDGDLIVVE